MEDLTRNRTWMLLLVAVCTFASVALVLLQVVPGPHKELDYMVIGTVSVMAALFVVFLVLIKTSFKSSDLFFKSPKDPAARKVRPTPQVKQPRRPHTSSIFGDLNQPDLG
jgi:hypothetical protein